MPSIITTAAFVRNRIVAKRLLEHGAGRNIPNQCDGTALDSVSFLEATLAFWKIDSTDRVLIARMLETVNENTSELIRFLKSNNAEMKVFQPSSWERGSRLTE